MSAEPSKNHNFVKAADAAKRVGYAADYVTRLARTGKISGEKIGRSWWVDPESLKLFSLQQEADKQERSEVLRERRVQERAMAEKRQRDSEWVAQLSTGRFVAAAQTAVIALSLFVGVHVLWFAFESEIRVTSLQNGVAAITHDINELVVAPVLQVAAFAFIQDYPTVVRESDIKTGKTQPAVGTVVDSTSPRFEGLILLGSEQQVGTDEITAVRESFSDEVTVEFDGEDTGVVTPVFRETTGESYRFLMVPVKRDMN